ncbi:MAG: hypothetical protein K9N06_02955 [Candidatus Cloacimonetes bacterium]|nr:hypothetical protein [Candidatus Cloacimonadota bacterium]
MEYYYLFICCNKLNLLAGINGAWLFRDFSGKFSSIHEPVNLWLLPETNYINIDYFQLNESLLKKGKAEIEIKLFRADTSKPESLESAEEYYKFAWKSNDYSPIIPQIMKIPLNLQLPGIVQYDIWEKAEDLTDLNLNKHEEEYSQTDVNEIYQLLRNYISGIIAGDIDTLLSLQEFKFREESKSRFKKFNDVQENIRGQYAKMAGSKLREWNELSKDNISFRKIYGNKILEINKNVNQYPVSVVIDDEILLEVPIYLSRLSGNWIIVR